MSRAAQRSLDAAAGRRRSQARLAAVQALFQIQDGNHSVEEVIDQFLSFRSHEAGEAGMPADADRDFFVELVSGASQHASELEPLVASSLGASWTMARLDRLMRALLQAGVFELKQLVHVPARVVINEYVEIAHAFYDAREPGFVNSLLDRVARELRAAEFPAAADRDG